MRRSVSGSDAGSLPKNGRRGISARGGSLVLYGMCCDTYTRSVKVKKTVSTSWFALTLGTMLASAFAYPHARQQPAVAAAKSRADMAKPKGAGEAAQTPAEIELLETRIRFEADGTSRKEVHARVRINTELGTRQFGRLNFDYTRAFESVEIPLARITHASGGTADILPSAVSDQPSAAVAELGAYQDVRRKTVRILGLQPADVLEYRVITTTTRAPLGPDFYLFHTFAKDAIVGQERFELDLPAGRPVRLHVDSLTPAANEAKSEEGGEARVVRRWEYKWNASNTADVKKDGATDEPDVALTTFESWEQLSARLAEKLAPKSEIGAEVQAQARELVRGAAGAKERVEAIYDFVSEKIATVDLPLDATGFRTRPAAEILSSGYGTAGDKAALFAALARAAQLPAILALAGAPETAETMLPRPSMFTHFLVWSGKDGPGMWLDPGMEVAPFGVVSANLRGKPAFLLLPEGPENPGLSRWLKVPDVLPFAASQQVRVEATLGADGDLEAKLGYVLRGDNELLLRVAFHQTAKDKWNDLAQLLSISDGFRGKVGNVTASDPLATREPFRVEYQISMPKFVDWSKKPVRVPALLPQLGLPDVAAKPQADSAIELGTPLDVDTQATLRLPPGTTARTPTGTSVDRDYATYSSKYGLSGSLLTASRRVRFLLQHVPAARSGDYRAFLHAVQSDEAQDFVLIRTGEENTTAEKSTAKK